MPKKPVKSKAKKRVPKSGSIKPKSGTAKKPVMTPGCLEWGQPLESRFVPDDSQIDPYGLPDEEESYEDTPPAEEELDGNDHLIDALVKENQYLRDRLDAMDSAVKQEAANAAVNNTQVHRFRTALELFGKHLDACKINPTWLDRLFGEEPVCSCGLSTYLDIR